MGNAICRFKAATVDTEVGQPLHVQPAVIERPIHNCGYCNKSFANRVDEASHFCEGMRPGYRWPGGGA
jgi:hypothetical protein